MDTKVADPLRGALLAGRYRIMGRLARGRATAVYQARDERLDRSVAIRIVNPEYVLDAEVLERLAAEAETTARLAHPNIVAIFDQGSHEGAPYLVMEYVRGRTLRDVVDDRGRLDPAESLAIIEQVLAALAVAHRTGLVHRDVRPENILVAPPPNGSGDLVDAVVKVADFGLARASDVTRSQVSPLLGTAPYLAPELITDGRGDVRADVYAAGVVLFEMLTGRLPFPGGPGDRGVGDRGVGDSGSGEGPGALAWRHVDEEIPPPSHVVDGVPAPLDDLIHRATRRDPAARPRDAATLLAQIQAAREDVGALTGPTRSLAHPTVLVPPVAGPYRPGWSRLPAQRPSGRVAAGAGARVQGADGPPGVGERLRQVAPAVAGWLRLTANRLRYTAAGRRWLVIGVVVLGLLLMLGGWWVGVGRYTAAPSLLQLTKDGAISEAERQGFTISFGAPMYSENVPADTVLAQQPPPGGRIVRGGTVTVFLSRGPERYAVPDITGQALAFALTRIPDQFLVEQVDGFSDTLPAGYVAGTEPAPGTILAPGGIVRVIVVTGPFPVHVPSVVGQQLGAAQNQLRAAGFTNIVVEHRDDDKPKDQVLEQIPEGGKGMTSAEGQQVTLWVSNGPKQPMPDLVGRNCRDAVQQLLAMTDLHLNVSTPGVAEPLRVATSVKTQSVPAGDPLTVGQTVELACGI